MAYIYIDESGDLGFNWNAKKTSKFFIITFLFVKSNRPVEKIIKNIFKNLSTKEIKAMHGALHSNKCKPITRNRVLSALATKDVAILSIYLNKKKVYTKLQDEKHVLYSYVTNILLDRVFTKKLIPLTGKINIVASRRETNIRDGDG